MIRLRLNFNQGAKEGRITLEDYLSKSRIEWHGVQLGKPDWGENSHSVALTLHNIPVSQVRYIAINAYWQPLAFELPPVKGNSDAAWLRLIDTSLPSPDDITEACKRSVVVGASYLVNPRSVVMLHYDNTTETK
jgi:glycogen operon protein